MGKTTSLIQHAISPHEGNNLRRALSVLQRTVYNAYMALAENQKIFPGVNMDEAREQVRTALRRAFAACGGQTEFWRKLNDALLGEGQKGLTKQAVSWWLSEGSFVDQRYWPHFERMTDMATTRRHLRPDLYGLAQP